MNGSNDIDYFQNLFQISPRHARQYFMCPHCSFHLCFEHGQEYQQQIQNQIHSIQNHAVNLEQTIQNYQPVQAIIEQVYKSLYEWKDKMFQFIDQYSEQIRSHIEHAQNRLNEQWNITKGEYLQSLENFVQEPIDRLLRVPKQIHPEDVRHIHRRFISIQSQITDLLTFRDLLRINFDSCSLAGDINISRGHFPSPKLPSNSIETVPSLDQIILSKRFDILSSNTPALAVRTVDHSNSIILTWMKPSTLLIFDSEYGLTRRVDVEPAFISIHDILWCEYLNIFLLAGAALHTFDIQTNEIKQIFTPENPHIWSITTHKTNLYVLYAMGESPLIEHRSLPSFHLIQKYTRDQVFSINTASSIEVARCIRTNDHHLAMTIRNSTTHQWRVDVFNFQLQRLIQGEILGQAVHPDYWCCLLTSYRSNYWLIMNNTSEPETVTLVDGQGRVRQQIQHDGYNICVIESKQQLVVKDQHGLAVFRF
ncbi:unnamed protein product [Adineta ricciae]|uniref:Uncharacterized protein n=1 Tax=Adineta ricciae TaxID=249248 RepID=A0A815AS34_ADIRI|nr:unnamed protein product [Adineta ricciae]CAF1258228.1 unnamed protein product [Adineta ricciae]